jgi:hypothetical protein
MYKIAIDIRIVFASENRAKFEMDTHFITIYALIAQLWGSHTICRFFSLPAGNASGTVRTGGLEEAFPITISSLQVSMSVSVHQPPVGRDRGATRHA